MAKKNDKQPSDKQSENTDRFPQRWKPGQSGNPNGRPPGDMALTTAVRQELMSLAPVYVKKSIGTAMFKEEIAAGNMTAFNAWMKREVRWLDCFIKAKFHHALTPDGDTIFTRIWEMMDGKAIARITGAEGGAIKFEEEMQDLSRLTIQEIRKLKELQDKAKGR
jgi:Family of unknown function (DUF5681)